MKSTAIAIDLAKSVFEVGVSDRPGHVAESHRLTRSEIGAFIARQEDTTIFMEACSSAHYWGRTFQSCGHHVKRLPALYVRPYMQRNKTDRTDVKGMLEAGRNSDIVPVPIKTESQQQLTALHRVRSSWVEGRTKRLNAARACCGNSGLSFPWGGPCLVGRIKSLVKESDSTLPLPLRELLGEMMMEVDQIETRVRPVEKQLQALATETPVVARLTTPARFCRANS
jgi:transposase